MVIGRCAIAAGIVSAVSWGVETSIVQRPSEFQHRYKKASFGSASVKSPGDSRGLDDPRGLVRKSLLSTEP